MNTLTPEQLADLLLKIADHAKKQALSFIQGNASISGSPTEEVEWFYDELRNSEHPDWPLTLSTDHLDKAVDKYHAGFKSAFQPVGGESLGGPEAIRAPASGFVASGADVTREWRKHLKGEIIQKGDEEWDGYRWVPVSDVCIGDRYVYEKWKTRTARPLTNSESQTPDHSALLVEAREALGSCKTSRITGIPSRTGPGTYFRDVQTFDSKLVNSALSKLQSIKL